MRHFLSLLALSFITFLPFALYGHNGIDHSLPENAAMQGHEESHSKSHGMNHGYGEYIILGGGLLAGAYVIKRDKGNNP